MGGVVADPMTPEWWLDRLYRRLLDQRDEVQFYDDYYTGNHPLPWLAPQARDEFRRILQMTRSNYMGLVCDAVAERANVEGFRLGGNESSDAETWRIWQANDLDSDSDMAWLESLVGGKAFFLVAPNPADRRAPFVWVEHPSQCAVAYEPGSNRRVRKAGLKVWNDDWTQELHSTLYLMVPGSGLRLFKYRAPRPKGGEQASVQWEPREVSGEDWPADGGMDRLPLIEIPNNPRLLTGGVSELADLTDIQDRINKTLADRLITQDYGAFPQKWASAWPEEDEDGNPNTIDVGRNRMVTTEVAETKFGQWDAAALDPYSAAKREDVKDIASRSRTPAQYLLGEMSNVNGETLKASESGLVSKTKQRCRSWGEAAEEAMRLARGLAGLSVPSDANMETIWTDPQYRTEGERTDAAVKLLASGLASLRAAREYVGFSQTQIRQLETDDVTEGALNPAARDVLNAGGTDAAAGGA